MDVTAQSGAVPVVEPFDRRHLSEWSARALVLLAAAQHDIDALNVFPVPDGDTGTNLLLTWRAATAALDETGPKATGVSANPGPATLEPPPSSDAARWARGALLGARGNSGVIVAQLLRGIAESVGVPTQPADGEPGRVIAEALTRAVELGYAGVARPVEGTILTVAAAAAAAARATAGDGPVAVTGAAVEAAADALARTPEQLPVLAAAGVVDAGGQGLVLLLEALRAVLDPAAPTPEQVLSTYGLGLASAPHAHTLEMSSAVATAQREIAGDGAFEVIDGAFEVMYLLEADDDAASDVRQKLDALGASVVVVGGGGLWNVHVHTDDAGPAVEVGVAVGRVFRIRITPLEGATTHHEPPFDAHPPAADRTVVAVTPGPSLGALFESVGAQVVFGAPGDRPTPGALVAAAGEATEVLILPNDDDHVAVAEAAAGELRAGGAHVAVLRTHAVVQGLAALAVHDPSVAFTDDVVAMSAAAAATRFGGLARAEREAMTSAGICHPGQALGVVEGDIGVLGDDPEVVATEVADRMLAAGGELVTLVCGDDPWPGRPLADAVRRHLHETRLDVEVVIYDGGQPHYPLLMGVE
jgi:DAK2 domain fusion protein YloV